MQIGNRLFWETQGSKPLLSTDASLAFHPPLGESVAMKPPGYGVPAGLGISEIDDYVCPNSEVPRKQWGTYGF